MAQMEFMFAQELIVDNFAGGGGASLGLEWAFGRSPDIAINHDPEAVAMHTANHPNTQHYCEDVWKVDPVKAVDGRPVGFAWFSPDCKHFSKAKGGKPVSKKIRGLAWIVVKWAKKGRPRVLMLENVEEFQDWGPLTFAQNDDGSYQFDANGNPKLVPCQKRKGHTFERWVGELRRLGYRVEWRQLRACDYGAPTIRKRLFLIARCDGRAIVWPEPTHGDPKSDAVKRGKLQPWRTAAECINWSLPTQSIFLTKEEGKALGVRRPLADNTMKRIARGVQRYVLDAAEPFIVTANHGGDGFRGQDIAEPFKTITAARDAHGLVIPFLTEHANASHQRNMPADEPLRTVCAQVKGGHFALVSPLLVKNYGGNYNGPGVPMSDPMATVTTVDHHSLVACHLQRDFGNSIGHSAFQPVGTITAGGGGKTGLVTSHLLKLRGTCKDGQPNTEPMPTVTAGGLHIGEVRAFLVKYYGSDQDPKLTEPMHTVTTKDRFGLVTVSGEDYVIADIGMRMLSPRELYRAQGFPDSYIIDPEIEYSMNKKNGSGGKRRLSKTAQVRMCGNSVSPYMSMALAMANVGVKKYVKDDIKKAA